MLFRKKNGSLAHVCVSKRKVGFIGFLTNIQSLKDLFAEFVEKDHVFTSIATQSISQDHLERLFCQIRSLNGFNDNPPIEQFDSAYRKLLVNNLIFLPSGANFENSSSNSNTVSDILFVSAKNKNTKETVEEFHDNDDECNVDNVSTDELDELKNAITKIGENDQNNTDDYLKHISISRTAYNIECKIKLNENQSRFYCEPCLKVFDENMKCNDVYEKESFNEKPCESTVEICKIADSFLNIELFLKGMKFKTIFYAICQEIQSKIDSLYEASNFECDANHKLYMIRCIVDGYINKKCTYLAQKASLDIHEELLRSKLRKLLHFRGQ